MSQALPAAELKKRLLALSRRLHPDFHAASGSEAHRLAERNTGLLNTAHEILGDPARRADWIVRHLGGPGEDQERQMPQEFLLEVMEWNETIETAREQGSDANPEELNALAAELETQRAREMETLAELLDPLPSPGDESLLRARRHLNAVRYLDRALREITELRLAQASSSR